MAIPERGLKHRATFPHEHHRNKKSYAALWPHRGGARTRPRGAAGRGVRAAGRQWRRKDDYHQTADEPDGASDRLGTGAGCRFQKTRRARAGADRLWVGEPATAALDDGAAT